MNLPLMSPAALDNAVYELIARELSVANAMRFIARHNQPDGIDYIRDRSKWLPQDSKEVELLLNEPNSGKSGGKSGDRGKSGDSILISMNK